jgi:hypothetical protein
MYRESFDKMHKMGVRIAKALAASESSDHQDMRFEFRLAMASGIDRSPIVGTELLGHLIGTGYPLWMVDGAREAVFGGTETPAWWSEQEARRMMRDALSSYR